MTISQEQLRQNAVATADLLLQAVVEATLIESILESYEGTCRDALAQFGVTPRHLEEDDLKRLLFEILCFQIFIVMSQEAPKHITRSRMISAAHLIPKVFGTSTASFSSVYNNISIG